MLPVGGECVTDPRSDQTASAGCVPCACLRCYAGREIGVQTRGVKAKQDVFGKGWHVLMLALEVTDGKWHDYQCA